MNLEKFQYEILSGSLLLDVNLFRYIWNIHYFKTIGKGKLDRTLTGL